MKVYDFIGIGIGPFNLSIAALAENITGFSTLFLESKPAFSWHPGLMVPECHMQTGFLKDLVTAVDPTNPYSFLNYLVQHKKFYRFVTTEQQHLSRQEFADYLCWTARQLSNLAFNHQVTRVEFDTERKWFVIETQQGTYYARHICQGIGKKIALPDCIEHCSPTCFHASEMMLRSPSLGGKRVTIVGGGQSGADLFLNIFRGEWGQPSSLNWISRRNNFNALDEAAFANEYFTADYLTCFSNLDDKVRDGLLHEQKMTSDGITSASLLAIYRAMYHQFDVLREPIWARLYPSRSVTGIQSAAEGHILHLKHHLDHQREDMPSDITIFATGYRPATADFMTPLAAKLHRDNQNRLQINIDFTLQWQHEAENKIFAVNAGMHNLGIAEPQLSLMAWRAATVINTAYDKPVFDLASSPAIMQWLSHTTKTNSSRQDNSLTATRM